MAARTTLDLPSRMSLQTVPPAPAFPSQNTAPSRASSTRALMTSSSVLPPSPPSFAEVENYNQVGGTKLHLFAWPWPQGENRAQSCTCPTPFVWPNTENTILGQGAKSGVDFLFKKIPNKFNGYLKKKKISCISQAFFFPYVMHWRLSAAKSSGEKTTH